jgi:hypothetical protein
LRDSTIVDDHTKKDVTAGYGGPSSVAVKSAAIGKLVYPRG